MQNLFSPLDTASASGAALVSEAASGDLNFGHNDERVAFAMKSGSLGAWDWNIHSGEVLWSDSLRALHGLEPGAFGGKIEDVVACIHPDDRAEIERTTLHSMKSGEEQLIEYRTLWPDGSVHWLESRGRIYYDGAGQPARLSGVATDITARREAEDALRRSEERYRLLAENSLDLIGLLDLQGLVIYASPSHYQVLGYAAEALTGHSIFDILHADDAAPIGAALEELLEHNTNQTLELRLQHQNGGWVMVEAILSLVDNPDAQGAEDAQRLLLSARDITGRRVDEERLRLLESAVVNSNDAVVITEAGLINEPGPRIVYVNQAFTRITGYEFQEIEGRSPRFLQGVDTDRDACDELRRGLENWESVDTEILNYRKDGTPFWVQMSIVPVSNAGGYSHFVSIQRDVTERRQSEEALQEAKEEAERANRAKSEFLSRMSHELRTPLNAILGFGQLMQLDERPAPDVENIDHIVKAGRHLLALIDEVLHISRIEAGQLSLSIEPVPAWELLREVLDLVQPMAREHNVQLHLAPDCQLYVLADRQRLKQILLNLLSNSIKYNHQDGQVRIRCEAQGARAYFFVADDGRGLSSEQQQRLFTPFDRLGIESSGIEGTGIGLALSQRLAHAMDGDITVHSEAGQGSTFCLDMPFVEAPFLADNLAHSADGAASSALSGQATRTILYIEDNLPNLNLVETILRRHANVRLLAAMQGSMGMDLAREHLSELILLDLHLPDINGEEVLRQLRADATTQHIPVIVLSADAVPARIQRLLDAGADTYLTKPLHIQQFLDVLQKTLPDFGV